MGLGRRVVVVHADNGDFGLNDRQGWIVCGRHVEIFLLILEDGRVVGYLLCGGGYEDSWVEVCIWMSGWRDRNEERWAVYILFWPFQEDPSCEATARRMEAPFRTKLVQMQRFFFPPRCDRERPPSPASQVMAPSLVKETNHNSSHGVRC